MMSTAEEVARACLVAAIEYLEREQACPFCDLGHTTDEDGMPETHAIGCPLRGYERTEDIERLRAWACPTQAAPEKEGTAR